MLRSVTESFKATVTLCLSIVRRRLAATTIVVRKRRFLTLEDLG